MRRRTNLAGVVACGLAWGGSGLLLILVLFNRNVQAEAFTVGPILLGGVAGVLLIWSPPRAWLAAVAAVALLIAGLMAFDAGVVFLPALLGALIAGGLRLPRRHDTPAVGEMLH